ncbi:hypothetical protein BsWGS_08248 [Bradybaena similaris]
MDIQSKDVLEQLLKRLDKIENQQHKLDRVMERLDTLQNILERQNQKQNLLDELLVKMAIKPEQDKEVTTEQLQGAQQASVQSFCVIDSKEDSTLFPHEVTQTFQGWANQTADTLKSIDDRTVDTVQKCHQLISWSQNIEVKMTELTDNNKENMKTFLVEIRSVKDLIKGQTNSELIWLNNQIDKKLSDIVSVVREIYQQQTEAKEEIVHSAGQVVKTVLHHDKQQGSATESLGDKRKSSTEISDKQMQTILDLERSIQQLNSLVCDVPREMKTSLDSITATNKQIVMDLENIRNSIVKMTEQSKEQSLSVNESLKSELNKLREAIKSEFETKYKMLITESETQYCRIINSAESSIEDLKHLIQREGGNINKYKDEIENILTLINSLIGNLQGNMAAVEKEVKSTKASMISGNATVNKNLDEHIAELKDYIYLTKRQIFAVTEKEAQIVRDQIQGPLPFHGKYTFDFYIDNFKTLVRSGKYIESSPWHISEMRTCVTGGVRMLGNGGMKVSLLFGRHPREVGLQPRSGKSLRIKATICDIDVKVLPPVYVGDKTAFFAEMSVASNGFWGAEIGVTSCDELLHKGYGEKEGYLRGALLVRYEVEVS